MESCNLRAELSYVLRMDGVYPAALSSMDFQIVRANYGNVKVEGMEYAAYVQSTASTGLLNASVEPGSTSDVTSSITLAFCA